MTDPNSLLREQEGLQESGNSELCRSDVVNRLKPPEKRDKTISICVLKYAIAVCVGSLATGASEMSPNRNRLNLDMRIHPLFIQLKNHVSTTVVFIRLRLCRVSSFFSSHLIHCVAHLLQLLF